MSGRGAARSSRAARRALPTLNGRASLGAPLHPGGPPASHPNKSVRTVRKPRIKPHVRPRRPSAVICGDEVSTVPAGPTVYAARRARNDGHEIRLQNGSVRRVHSASERKPDPVVRDAGGQYRVIQVMTIEAVAKTLAGRQIQEAWFDLEVPQCGYCQSGQIMSASAPLASNPRADKDTRISTTRAVRCITITRTARCGSSSRHGKPKGRGWCAKPSAARRSIVQWRLHGACRHSRRNLLLASSASFATLPRRRWHRDWYSNEIFS